MKRTTALIIIAFMLALLCSCAQDAKVESDGVGYVSFSLSRSRSFMGSISYAEPESLLWDITATKTTGSTLGAGLYEDVTITDEIGPFATGEWTFTFKGYDGETEVYNASVTAEIAVGDNSIDVSLSTSQTNGTISIVDSTYTETENAISQIDYYLDGSLLTAFTPGNCTLVETGTYKLPDYSTTKKEGVYTFTVKYITRTGAVCYESSAKIRVVGGMTTEISFLRAEGDALFNMNITQQDAIVTE